MKYISGMKRYQTNIDAFMDGHNIKTDKDLADRLGITPQKLSARLKNNISMNTLEMIANYFEITVKDLLK
jgi:DNA-binding Xre family transcriptional regulator